MKDAHPVDIELRLSARTLISHPAADGLSSWSAVFAAVRGTGPALWPPCEPPPIPTSDVTDR